MTVVVANSSGAHNSRKHCFDLCQVHISFPLYFRTKRILSRFLGTLEVEGGFGFCNCQLVVRIASTLLTSPPIKLINYGRREGVHIRTTGAYCA